MLLVPQNIIMNTNNAMNALAYHQVILYLLIYHRAPKQVKPSKWPIKSYFGMSTNLTVCSRRVLPTIGPGIKKACASSHPKLVVQAARLANLQRH
jgi:hypothetical protein